MSFIPLPALETFGNNDVTSLEASMGSSDVVASVASIAGFPTDGQFRLLIDSELLLVIGYDAGAEQWQVVRGIEGTTAASHALDAPVTCILTKGSLVALKQNSGGTTFVYRDSEPNPTGNVFNTFDGAYAAAQALAVPTTIVIDDSLANCSTGNASGSGAAYGSVVGITATITGLHNMTPDVVGLTLFIATEGPEGNNGTFPISGYLSPTSVQITNAAATPDVTNYQWYLLDGITASITSAPLLTMAYNLVNDLTGGGAGVMTPSMVGQNLTILDADDGGNIGVFPIAGYISPSAVWINNPSAVANDDILWSALGGAAAAITAFDGSNATVTGLTGMTPDLVGTYLNLSNTANSNNSGLFTITTYLSATSVQVSNSSAVSPDYGIGGTVGAPTIAWDSIVSFDGSIGAVQPVGVVTGLTDITTDVIGNSLMIQNAVSGGNSPVTGSAATIASFSASNQQVILTGLTGILPTFAGGMITISGAGTSLNNGTFLIVQVVSDTSVAYLNPSGVAPDANNGSISWSIPVVTNNNVAAAIVGWVSSTSVLWNNPFAVGPDTNNGSLWWYVGTNYDLSSITLAGAKSICSSFYIYDGATLNSGVQRITDNLKVYSEQEFQQYVGTLGLVEPYIGSITVANLGVFECDSNSGMFDASLAGTLEDITLVVDNGSVTGASTYPWLNLGNNENLTLSVSLYQNSYINNTLVGGINGAFELAAYDTVTGNPSVFYPLFYSNPGNATSIQYNALANSLVPFAGEGTFPTPNNNNSAQGLYNVQIGTMYYDQGTNQAYWWTGSVWTTYATPFNPLWAMITASGPQNSGLTAGNPVLCNTILSSNAGNDFAGYSSPGRFFVTYYPGSGVNVKLTANIGSLFDGSITYQWVDVSEFEAFNSTIASFSNPHVTLTNMQSQVTPAVVGQQVTISGAATPANNGTFPITAWNSPTSVTYLNSSAVAPDANNGSIAYNIQCNIPVGNVSGNVGSGTPGDIVAMIPVSYFGGANTNIFFEFQLTFVSGTTFIGENTAGGFILPWMTIEQLGSPQ